MTHPFHDHSGAFGPGGPGGGPVGRGRGPRRFLGDPEGAFFGRGPRAARGDVRAALLSLLAEEPKHGYQMIRELSERSGGVWSPSPGSVYPTLQLLEDEGLVVGETKDSKRVFAITDAGRAVLAERGTSRPAPWEEVSSEIDSSVLQLRDGIRQLVGAVRQVVHSGSPDQVARTKVLLDETRRGLYRLLAEEPDQAASGTS